MNTDFKQKVKHYCPENAVAILESQNGNVYPCKVSDKVRFTMNMRNGDWAIVRILNKKNWVIVDVEAAT